MDIRTLKQILPIYVYTSIRKDIFTYTHTFLTSAMTYNTCTYTYLHIHMYTYLHIHLFTCLHLHKFTHTHLYNYANIFLLMFKVTDLQIYIYTCMHIYISIYT